MESGLPRFPPGFTCPVVLRDILRLASILRTGLSPCLGPFSKGFCYLYKSYIGALQPRWDESHRFALVCVRSPLLAESLLISFPPGTEMFHFPGLATHTYVFSVHWAVEPPRVSPFGHFRVKVCLATRRNFSQLATSFIASVHLGIHRQPLVA